MKTIKIAHLYPGENDYNLLNAIIELDKEGKSKYLDVKTVLNNLITNDKYEFSKNDKLHILKNCSVPRFKLKEICKDNKVRIVRDIEKANAIFISDNTIYKLFDKNNSHNWVYELEHFLTEKGDLTFEAVKYLQPGFKSSISLTSLLNKVKADGISHVAFSYYRFNNQISALRKSTEIRNIGNIKYVKPDFVSLINTLKEVPGKIYHEEQLQSKINSSIMTEEQYHSIKRLLSSNDYNDREVAITTISNCDYKNSAVYLLLLLQEFSYTIYESKTSRQVTFKALLNFFNIHDVRYLSIQGILEILEEKGYLNNANLQMLSSKMLEEFKSKNPLSKYYSVDDLPYSEKLIKTIESNVLDDDLDTLLYFEPQEQINPHI